MDINEKYWELKLKHKFLLYMYDFMDIRYTGMVIDIIKEFNKVVFFVTLPQLGYNLYIKIPISEFKKWNEESFCEGLRQYMEEEIQAHEEMLDDDNRG